MHPKLIAKEVKVITYYQNENNHYFLFVWASKEDLSKFWKAEDIISSTGWDYIMWMLTQLGGLAEAIEELYHDTSKSHAVMVT
ncbi:hypothetical protein BKA56DRAFT_678317 [Ilyonectria sp. MPI-CAGE-AT-0026]|nr:hypothetical protein BKA56DRAFT_678317 [Ilyonectria sp. MPI-CAGE-AT-0026]